MEADRAFARDTAAVTRKADGTEERRLARYVTVWRRGEDGRWKVVTDLGN